MKTKTIPFDLEMAKKIQAGEIEGKIKYSEGDSYAYDADILKFDLIADKSKAKPNSTLYRTIVAVIDFDNHQGVGVFNTNGYGYNSNGDDTKLFLELPEETPEEQHPIEESELYQAGYKVGFEAGRCVAFDEKKGRAIKKETPRYKFKPFDRVLVRHSINGINAKWKPQLFSMVTNDPFDKDKILYETIDGCYYDKCVPFAGNEHLVGTTDNPKED